MRLDSERCSLRVNIFDWLGKKGAQLTHGLKSDYALYSLYLCDLIDFRANINILRNILILNGRWLLNCATKDILFKLLSNHCVTLRSLFMHVSLCWPAHNFPSKAALLNVPQNLINRVFMNCIHLATIRGCLIGD